MDYSIILLWLLVLIISFSFAIYLKQQTNRYFSNSLSRSEDGIENGELLPYSEIKDIFNESINLSKFNEHKDNAMILFLSNSCHMCQGIFDIIPEIQSKYKDTHILIFMKDDSKAPFANTDDFLRRFPTFTFNEKTKAINTTQELQESFKLVGYPFAYHLSKKGIVVNKGIINKMQDIDTLMKGF